MSKMGPDLLKTSFVALPSSSERPRPSIVSVNGDAVNSDPLAVTNRPATRVVKGLSQVDRHLAVLAAVKK